MSHRDYDAHVAAAVNSACVGLISSAEMSDLVRRAVAAVGVPDSDAPGVSALRKTLTRLEHTGGPIGAAVDVPSRGEVVAAVRIVLAAHRPESVEASARSTRMQCSCGIAFADDDTFEMHRSAALASAGILVGSAAGLSATLRRMDKIAGAMERIGSPDEEVAALRSGVLRARRRASLPY